MPAETRPETPCCCRMVPLREYADPYDYHSPYQCGYTPQPIKEEIEALKSALAELRAESERLRAFLAEKATALEAELPKIARLQAKAALADEIAARMKAVAESDPSWPPFSVPGLHDTDWLDRHAAIGEEG
jgi:hypothetical protein